MEITLQTFVGTNIITGELVEWDRDEILYKGKRIGFVGHAEGSGIALLRIVDEKTLAEITKEVAKQRKQQGKADITDKFSMPPDPEKMREALAQLKAEQEGDGDE